MNFFLVDHRSLHTGAKVSEETDVRIFYPTHLQAVLKIVVTNCLEMLVSPNQNSGLLNYDFCLEFLCYLVT